MVGPGGRRASGTQLGAPGVKVPQDPNFGAVVDRLCRDVRHDSPPGSFLRPPGDANGDIQCGIGFTLQRVDERAGISEEIVTSGCHFG
jgi:hypothetical protein